MRGKHGKGTKTHLKYDDGDRSLYLNVKLKEDNFWSKVYPEYAQNWLRKIKTKDAEYLDQKLNLEGPAFGGPRRASLNTDTQQEQVRKATRADWTGKARSSSTTNMS